MANASTQTEDADSTLTDIKPPIIKEKENNKAPAKKRKMV